MISRIECRYRQNVRFQDDIEVAECQLLCQVTGINGGPHVVVRQPACEKCRTQSVPSPARLNPTIAALLYQLCERVIDQDGVEECDLPKAQRLQKWAYGNIPFVAGKSDPHGLCDGLHQRLCSSHFDDDQDSSLPCIKLPRSLPQVLGQAYHRSGWPYAVGSLTPLLCRQGILLDEFVEQRFYYAGQARAHTTAWVGIFHHPAQLPPFLEDQGSLEKILLGSAWEESEKHLRGAIALSDHVARYLSSRLKVPVVTIKHPSEIPEQTWSETSYLQNERKRLVQLGWYLRNTRAIYQVPSVAHYDKFRCLPEKPWIIAYDQRVTNYWSSEGSREEFGDVTELGYIANEEYDALLTSCVVLTELFEASANNVVIECIARNTPLVVNRHPAAVEYLTPDYPLFFDNLNEVPSLLAPERVLAAHRYLRDMKKDWLNGETFCNSIREALMTMDLSRPMPAIQSDIEGWYDARFDQILQQISQQQQAGNIAEIGVHHGKSFVHLYRMCRPGELALAVDCFDMQQHNRSLSGNGKKEIFLRNLPNSNRIRILEGNSLDLTAADYLAAVGGRFRLFHVDGGHDVETALHDLTHASRSLTGDGVLIVDDVFNADWPEVSEALYRFVATSDIKPFAIAHNKVCLSRVYYQLQSPRLVKSWLGQQVQIM